MRTGNGLFELRARLARIRRLTDDIRASRGQTAGLHGVLADAAGVARETTDAIEALRNELAHGLAVVRTRTTSEHDAMVAQLRSELAELRSEGAGLRRDLAELTAQSAAQHERAMLGLRMVRDDDEGTRARLTAAREHSDYELAYSDPEPLVTVIITTYGNWQLLRDRCLPSVLAQTYERWEAIVVGDGAPDEARVVVESFADERIRFVNLPYRGPYPDDPQDAWHISGTSPWNAGLGLAAGRWIASNDDDDALWPTYVESLLQLARDARAEVPYGYLNALAPDGTSQRIGTFPPVRGHWGMQAALFHAGLRFLPLAPSDWVFGVPNDASFLERMLRIGVRFAMLDDAVVDYYPSRLWSDGEQRLTRREKF